MAMDTPFGDHALNFKDFVHLVVDRSVRPGRPVEDGVRCQGLSNDLWKVAECCWVKESNDRLKAAELCDELEKCLASQRESKVTSLSLPLRSKLQTGPSTRGAQFISSPQPILGSRDKQVTLRKQVTSHHPTKQGPERMSRSSSQRSQQGSSKTSNPPLRHRDVDGRVLDSAASSTKQSPPPAITQRGGSFRNFSVKHFLPTKKEPNAGAQEDLWDGEKSIEHYLCLAQNLRDDGERLKAQGDYEGAMMHFAQAETLVLEKIPKHRVYPDIPPQKQHNLALV